MMQAIECAPVFTPNVFVDIRDTLAFNIAALRDYDEEMRLWPHAHSFESVISLACWRGASVGIELAEAFMLRRELA